MQQNASPETREFLHRGKELFLATKPFAEESRTRSWAEVAITLVPLALSLGLAAWIREWPLRLLFSLLAGLLMVRAFILYHDFLHGAILRNSKIGRVIMYGIGVLLMTPPRAWRESHNYHHANVGKICANGEDPLPVVITDIGAFPMLSIHEWRRANRRERFGYRITRHPLTIVLAYFTVFVGNICLGSFFRNPRKHWPSALIFLAHAGAVSALLLGGGWKMMVSVYLIPLWLATALGAGLFYIQHSAPGLKVYQPRDWNLFEASLEAASCLQSGRVFEWFTGCIGYHHVHHINAKIPFYRLRKTMNALPDLQHPVSIRVRLPEIIACFQANLWDPDRNRLITYREAASAA